MVATTCVKILLLAGVVNCAVYRMVQKQIEGHEGQCYIDSSVIQSAPREFIRPGERAYIKGSCAAYDCEAGEDLQLIVSTCGKVGVQPPCVVVPGDENAQYPKCCPRISCPQD